MFKAIRGICIGYQLDLILGVITLIKSSVVAYAGTWQGCYLGWA